MILMTCIAHMRFRCVATGCDGCQVGIDVFLPHAEPGKDVRRHVQGVRCGRSDLSVSPRGWKPEFRHSRHVVRMNQIVRDTRMIRLNQEQFFQDGGRLLPLRVCRIVVGIG